MDTLKKIGTFTLLTLTGAAAITAEGLAKEYPYTYRSSHFLGRGDTGISDADNEDAIFYNPAGLGYGKSIYKRTVLPSIGLQLSNATQDIVKKIALQEAETTDALREVIGVPQSAGLNAFSGIVFKQIALGGYASSTNTILIAKDPDQGATETAFLESSSTAGLAVSFAQPFGKYHSAGITTRFVTKSQASAAFLATDASSITDNEDLIMTGTGTAFDLGYMMKYQGSTNYNLGFTIENFLDTTYEPNEDTALSKEERPLKDDLMTLNLGFSIEKVARLSAFKFLIDYRDILQNTGHTAAKRIHLGTEISVDGYMGLTAGLNQGYPTYGIYTDIRIFRVDLGIYTEEIGNRAGERGDKRIFLRVLAGF